MGRLHLPTHWLHTQAHAHQAGHTIDQLPNGGHRARGSEPRADSYTAKKNHCLSLTTSTAISQHYELPHC